MLDENVSADWLVIGGGFAGLSAARRLNQLHPTDKVVFAMEAIRVGDWGSGAQFLAL